MKLGFVLAGLFAGSVVMCPVLARDDGAAAIPDFSGVWARTTFGYETLASVPGPLRNLQRRSDGRSDAQQLVGDYNSAILTPRAAEIVKKMGDISRSGLPFPDPSNQCAMMAPPYILRINEMEMVQQPHVVTILYMQDHQVRRIRINGTHPAKVTPSWHGDSVGHYEGDTLVVDTVGVRIGPTSMVDMFGTPHSEALHVVERYRLVDADVARRGVDGEITEYARPDGPAGDGVFADYDHDGKGLQVRFTVEDQHMFAMPWSAQVTYMHALNDWEERVCAENLNEFYNPDVPKADKPDF